MPEPLPPKPAIDKPAIDDGNTPPQRLAAAATNVDVLAATDDLRRAAGAAISTLPGVTRLEPTLINALQRLRAAAPLGLTNISPVISSASPAAGEMTVRSAQDGVQLTRRADRVDVRVELITHPNYSALDTARQARGAVRDCITNVGLQPGTIDITILGIASAEQS